MHANVWFTLNKLFEFEFEFNKYKKYNLIFCNPQAIFKKWREKGSIPWIITSGHLELSFRGLSAKPIM